MMKSLCGCAVLVFGAVSLTACAEEPVQPAPSVAPVDIWQANWQMIAPESSIKFSSIYTGDSFDGHFGSFETKIKFDPKDLSNSIIRATIDLASVDAGEIERTEALPGKEWFYVKSFPKAVFESNTFTHIDGDKYEVSGEFTLRGTTKQLSFPFTLHIEDGTAEMQGAFTLNRRDFNVGTGMWKSASDVAHEVDVKVVVKAKKT